MLITILQITAVLIFLVLFITIVFKITRKSHFVDPLPDHFLNLLDEHVDFYHQLDEPGKKIFEKRMQQFYAEVRITGIKTDVEDLDQVLIGAAAVIPVFDFKEWEYTDLHEVLLYPDAFSRDFDQSGYHRTITGMVGSGPLQNVMILSKQALRHGFLNKEDKSNAAIHEFAHMIDKMDGAVDGVPQALLSKQSVIDWQKLMRETMQAMRNGESDIDLYGLTNEAEFFAVASEYFFKQPELFQQKHLELYAMMEQMFARKENSNEQ
ncbi:MAG: zinc-dependent peptidase [Bacteroidetes bacterium]|nr:zinc-dependent peptidase [Bacteroidota bacterium]MBS1930369.1 zinc-dependent peptidase [Bacteroidota bacterium]